MTDELWWYLTRSAALVSWAMALISVILGLLLSSKVLGRKPGFPWLLDLHRFTSALSVGFALLHMFTLSMHDYMEFTVADLLVPGASEWRPGAVAFGVVAFWAMALVQLSSLVRSKLPKKVWHGLHLLSYLVAGAATVHAAMAGTDWSNLFVQLVAVSLGSLVVGLTALRAGAFNLAKRKRRERQETLASVRAATVGAATVAPGPRPTTVPARPSLADRHAEAVARRRS